MLRSRLASWGAVLGWSTLFAIAYGPSPLFTSNQNQYFLHGLARAGWGYLQHDWLANTLDPTPVFSALVAWSYRLTHWLPIYYLLFLALAGIYLYSALDIARTLSGASWKPVTSRLFLAGFVAAHAAVLRAVLVRVFDPRWAYLLDGGVAGQRLLGDVFQPSAFGVFLLLSTALFLRRRYLLSALSIVVAATFHPTYLLSGALLTLAGMALLGVKEHRRLLAVKTGALTLLGVLPVTVYTFTVFRPTSAQAVARARELLVTFRIPHHALPAEWFDVTVPVKMALIVTALWLARRERIAWLLAIPFAVGLTLTLAQVITHDDALALLFPWRISAWLVPLSLTLVLARLAVWLTPRLSPAYSLPLISGVIGVIALGGALIFAVNLRQKMNSPAQLLFDFVRQNAAPGQVYLIPLDMQDFRLETGVPAYIEFKSIPYRDVDVLEWYRRVSMAGKVYRAEISRYACETLAMLRAEGVTHVVLPYDHAARACPHLERVFIKYEGYEVFVLREDQ
ncbi:MAG: hypothetical protein D6803_06590 [Anaerolineae bacterium]|nr:MAG: hypothetical protein D6803_06590 [Anaerolineae bacterium]